MSGSPQGPAWPALPRSIATSIRALVYLRGAPDRLVSIREIAAATGLSRPYLSKMLHFLRRDGLLEARRGKGGGFQLARAASEISVFDVVLAVEGESWRVGCLLYPESPPEQLGCSVRGLWSDLRRLIEEKLESVTLDQLPRMPELPTEFDLPE